MCVLSNTNAYQRVPPVHSLIREVLSPQLEHYLGPLCSTAIPEFLDLGLLYKGYMIALTIFCTNSINILAGVNGLEAGQTFILACAVALLNMTELAGYAGGVAAVREGHLFSLYLMLPLAATTLALLVFNWYPSQVRGDGGWWKACHHMLVYTHHHCCVCIHPGVCG